MIESIVKDGVAMIDRLAKNRLRFVKPASHPGELPPLTGKQKGNLRPPTRSTRCPAVAPATEDRAPFHPQGRRGSVQKVLGRLAHHGDAMAKMCAAGPRRVAKIGDFAFGQAIQELAKAVAGRLQRRFGLRGDREQGRVPLRDRTHKLVPAGYPASRDPRPRSRDCLSTAASRTRCAFVPPNPKELIPATRRPFLAAQGRVSVEMANAAPSRETFGLSLLKWIWR